MEIKVVDVSIIIPIYNMEQYLKRCLDSILAQSISSFEVIMVDDGSTDDTEKICLQYLKDERFHYYKQQNSGVSVARNKGLDESQAEWISFVDPDDYLKPDFLEVLLDSRKDGIDIICCCCSSLKANILTPVYFYKYDTYFSEDDSIVVPIGFEKKGKKELLLELMDRNYGDSKRATAIGVPWGKLYRKQFICNNNLRFDRDLIRMQDNIFNMFAFEKARTVVYRNVPLYIYNLDNISTHNRKYDPRVVDYFGKLQELRYNYLKENQLILDREIYSAYCKETTKLANVIMTKYFLHKDNPNSFENKVTELREYFSADIYQEVFNTKKISFERTSYQFRILLIRKRMYSILIFVELLFQKANEYRQKTCKSEKK